MHFLILKISFVLPDMELVLSKDDQGKVWTETFGAFAHYQHSVSGT